MKLRINYILLFALIISAISYYFFIFNSVNGKLKKTLHEILDKEKLEINNKKRLEKSEKLYVNNRELFTEIYKIYEKLPKYDEIKQIITDLEYLARENSIVIVETSIEPLQKYFSNFTCSKSKDNISEEELKNLVYCESFQDVDLKYTEKILGLSHVRLTLEGTFCNLIRFFNIIQKSVYLLPIESITISKYDEGSRKTNFFIVFKVITALKDFRQFLKIEYPFIKVSEYKNLYSDAYFEQFLSNFEDNCNESLFKSSNFIKEKKIDLPILPTILNDVENSEDRSYEDREKFALIDDRRFEFIKPEVDKKKDVEIRSKFKEKKIEEKKEILDNYKVSGVIRYKGIVYVIAKRKNKMYILRENELIDDIKINKILPSLIEMEIYGERFNYELK